eukprot:1139442-Pelagomonas_calceolata.AAC.3
MLLQHWEKRWHSQDCCGAAKRKPGMHETLNELPTQSNETVVMYMSYMCMRRGQLPCQSGIEMQEAPVPFPSQDGQEIPTSSSSARTASTQWSGASPRSMPVLGSRTTLLEVFCQPIIH